MSSTPFQEALRWCEAMLGSLQIVADLSKRHGDHESTTCRLKGVDGFCYLKIHETATHWQNEVHAYEQWAGVFGEYAPRLLAARDEPPLALVVTEVPGRIMEDVRLTPAREQAAWHAAGAALAPLHRLATGASFGPCRRDGSPAEQWPNDAVAMMSLRFERALEQAVSGQYITDVEYATVCAVMAELPAFDGESPVPCHRDYCTANWLVSDAGAWNGVIDFEFAYRDVWVVDIARDPHWSWIQRPDLVAALLEGYGRALSAREERQLLMARAEYALSAILWGRDHSFFGFEREGHDALAHLARQI